MFSRYGLKLAALCLSNIEFFLRKKCHHLCTFDFMNQVPNEIRTYLSFTRAISLSKAFLLLGMLAIERGVLRQDWSKCGWVNSQEMDRCG